MSDVCRICLQEDLEEVGVLKQILKLSEDRLREKISPCQCAGSMSSIHRYCLEKSLYYRWKQGFLAANPGIERWQQRRIIYGEGNDRTGVLQRVQRSALGFLLDRGYSVGFLDFMFDQEMIAHQIFETIENEAEEDDQYGDFFERGLRQQNYQLQDLQEWETSLLFEIYIRQQNLQVQQCQICKESYAMAFERKPWREILSSLYSFARSKVFPLVVLISQILLNLVLCNNLFNDIQKVLHVGQQQNGLERMDANYTLNLTSETIDLGGSNLSSTSTSYLLTSDFTGLVGTNPAISLGSFIYSTLKFMICVPNFFLPDLRSLIRFLTKPQELVIAPNLQTLKFLLTSPHRPSIYSILWLVWELFTIFFHQLIVGVVLKEHLATIPNQIQQIFVERIYTNK